MRIASLASIALAILHRLIDDRVIITPANLDG